MGNLGPEFREKARTESVSRLLSFKFEYVLQVSEKQHSRNGSMNITFSLRRSNKRLHSLVLGGHSKPDLRVKPGDPKSGSISDRCHRVVWDAKSGLNFRPASFFGWSSSFWWSTRFLPDVGSSENDHLCTCNVKCTNFKPSTFGFGFLIWNFQLLCRYNNRHEIMSKVAN